MAPRTVETLESFAVMIHDLLKSDRDAIVGVAGMTGEGKSAFLTLCQKKYAEISKTEWDFERMTWSRKELLKWIDGNKQGEGQLPEYSAILVDELFAMFYRRNWFDEGQIDAIATLNMCRDRHLFIGGNIPNLWELDTGFLSRLRFYVFIPERGRAWVFQPENNPFGADKWNVSQNCKLFRKYKNPFKSPNFVCEIFYPDWEPQEKKEYYAVRNQKRKLAVTANRSEKKERYSKIKMQRDRLIDALFRMNPELTNKAVAEVVDMSAEAVRMIRSSEWVLKKDPMIKAKGKTAAGDNKTENQPE